MKKKGGLYEYLIASGVLDGGNEILINETRRQYNKQRKAAWRRNNRKTNKELTIAFTADELKALSAAAKQHKRSKSRYVKDACLAYAQKKFVVPDILAVNSIRELLSMNYTALKRLFDDNSIPYQTGATVLQQIAELEQTIITHLTGPKTIEEYISNAVLKDPNVKGIINRILENL